MDETKVIEVKQSILWENTQEADQWRQKPQMSLRFERGNRCLGALSGPSSRLPRPPAAHEWVPRTDPAMRQDQLLGLLSGNPHLWPVSTRLPKCQNTSATED